MFIRINYIARPYSEPITYRGVWAFDDPIAQSLMDEMLEIDPEINIYLTVVTSSTDLWPDESNDVKESS